MNPKLLIVDDEPQIRDLLNEFLSDFFIVELASNGKEAVAKTKDWKPDVILMDMMMPEMDGVTACKLIREQDFTRHIPILMLTAANTSAERMNAFNYGVDDYISKPFEAEELKVRLLSKLKRSHDLQNVMADVMQIGNLYLDDRKREVLIGTDAVDLSPVEYGIVKLLMNCVEEVVSREKIMKSVWDDEGKSNRLIDAHITALRKKLQNFDGDFQTVYGAGYRLKKEKAHS
jgi:DNA-binding response OmpR family regulator